MSVFMLLVVFALAYGGQLIGDFVLAYLLAAIAAGMLAALPGVWVYELMLRRGTTR